MSSSPNCTLNRDDDDIGWLSDNNGGDWLNDNGGGRVGDVGGGWIQLDYLLCDISRWGGGGRQWERFGQRWGCGRKSEKTKSIAALMSFSFSEIFN